MEKQNYCRAEPSLSVADSEREEAGSPEMCGGSDGTADVEGEFLGCDACSDDSSLDSVFEEELDRLLELDNIVNPPYLMGTSETVENEENPSNDTAVMEASPYDEDAGVAPLPDSGVVTSRVSECLENVYDREVAPQRGLRSVRKSLFPLRTRSPTETKRKACAATPHMAGSSGSSGEDSDVPSPATEAMKSRPLNRRRNTSSPKATPGSWRKKASALPPPPWTSRSAKSVNKDDAAETRWKTEDEPDQKPIQVTFTPARTPGPQLDTSKDHTALELFQLFFSHDVVNTLCSNTNENAKRRQDRGVKEPWKPLCLEEMYKYLSIIIYMGLLNLHTVSDYWSQNSMYSLSFCRTVMTMTRFLAIGYSLHMSDPKEDEENEKKRGTAGYNALMRIQPLKDQILDACRAFYHPFQNLCIDESIVRSRAGHSHNRGVKTVRYKCGFKLCILADSQNGYTCDFNVLTHKNQSASGVGEKYDTVMNLLNVTHLGTGYHVYISHVFSSTTLFRDLYQKKLGACGPVRMGCTSIQENSTPARAQAGTVRWLRDGELLFTKWLDKPPVIMCSTIHQASGRVKKKRVIGKACLTTQSVRIPEIVESYNKHKGGFELSENLKKCYSVAHKTVKWYKTFFFQFIDIAVVNSFLLQKEIAQVKKTTTPMTHKQFREELCLQLADIGEQEEADEEEEYLEEEVEVVKGNVDQGEEPEVELVDVDQGEEPEEELVDVDQGEEPEEELVDVDQGEEPEEELVDVDPGEEPEELVDVDQGEEPEEELVEVKQPCYPVPFTDTTTADTSKLPNPRRQCCMCKEFKTYWQCGSCQVALCLIPDRNCFRAWHMDEKNLVAEVFKRQIKYNPYPHPWMEYGGKKIEFQSQKQARHFIKRHFGLRNNKE